MPTIFLIRHAEKPDDTNQGVDEQGGNDPRSLTPTGWQRAGALAVFFGPNGSLAAPDQIYASSPTKEKLGPGEKVGSKSARPLETVTPLAAKLGLQPDQSYGKGDEADLVNAITPLKGTTLICWQHEMTTQIATLILRSGAGVPAQWPSDRFDVVWTFTSAGAGGPWSFGQVCQRVLAGDGAQPIT